MADNFLERQHDDYLRRVEARKAEQRRLWQKRLRQYRQSLAAKEAIRPDTYNTNPSETTN